jgi:class 3 adenylate cyclase
VAEVSALEQRIQYCTTSDGVNIAYAVFGSGPPLLLTSMVVNSHLAMIWRMFPKPYASLAEHFTVIRYDNRGCGLSDRQPLDFSLDASVRDIEAVRAASGFDQIAVHGSAQGCPAAVAYAAEKPQFVSRLILSSPYATGKEAYETSSRLRFTSVLSDVMTDPEQWEFVVRTIAMRLVGPDSPQVSEMAELIKASIEPEALMAFRNANRAVDLTQMLPRVSAPTLVVHKLVEDLWPVAVTRRVASLIPNAELVVVESDFARYLDSADERAAVMKFLGVEHTESPDGPQAAIPLAFRTILFTDVVQNTALLNRIGDNGWRAVMREHDEIVRAALKEHGGTEISTSGDGFFASFGSSVRALQCAVEMQRALARRNETAEHPVEVRIGLNAGEPIEEGKDVLGTAVTMAARIMSQAGAGEILVSDVLRQLVAGKGFLFADRGEFVAKGFEEPARVYEVRWRE